MESREVNGEGASELRERERQRGRERERQGERERRLWGLERLECSCFTGFLASHQSHLVLSVQTPPSLGSSWTLPGLERNMIIL
ncbi:hypothetical protein AOLI_G00107790 [Acnodon oligacanthus]